MCGCQLSVFKDMSEKLHKLCLLYIVKTIPFSMKISQLSLMIFKNGFNLIIENFGFNSLIITNYHSVSDT